MIPLRFFQHEILMMVVLLSLRQKWPDRKSCKTPNFVLKLQCSGVFCSVFPEKVQLLGSEEYGFYKLMRYKTGIEKRLNQ